MLGVGGKKVERRLLSLSSTFGGIWGAKKRGGKGVAAKLLLVGRGVLGGSPEA